MAYISFQPSDHYSTKLYTGTGSSNAITGVGFQPDFTWIKSRSNTENHAVMDSVRGVEKTLRSDTNAVESTDTDGLTAFGADGFTVVSNAKVNTNTYTYASWNWKAGTTTGIVGSPSITPTSYSFNATSGFSIIKYTGNGVAGATIPHGLGVAPKFGIFKSLDVIHGWQVYHISMGNTNTMYLDTPDTMGASTSYFNDTSPSSTLMYMGTGTDINQSGTDYIAYMFADVQGFSKFSSYEGSADADGPFCYTGFTPAYVMIKNADAAQSWQIYTWDIQPFNVVCETTAGRLKADNNEAASAKTALDFYSNGFKIRTGAGDINTGGQQVIYAAFAEFPLVSSNDIPGTAR